MWNATRVVRPESSKRIIALFSDGSGSTLLWVHDHGLIDSDGEEREWDAICEHHSLWAYLPDEFLLFCEEDDSLPDHFKMVDGT